jgi:phosphoribosylglycinamide formyltransferase-1
VFISGRGSNMIRLLDAAQDPGYPAEIVLVVSNNTTADGLRVAQERGVPTAAFDLKRRTELEAAIHQSLLTHGVELIALAGYMRVLSAEFVGQWEGKIINIHPSLLPLYPGLDTHRRALEAGDREGGCTVHWVIPELDAGAPITQARVPILPGDSEQSLAARVLEQEHRIYPEALAQVAQRFQKIG